MYLCTVLVLAACSTTWALWVRDPMLWTLPLPLITTTAFAYSVILSHRYRQAQRERNELMRVVPPENVRLVHEDGSVVPIECRYIGRAHDGTQMWIATAPVGLVPGECWSLRVDMIPPKTSIAIEHVSC